MKNNCRNGKPHNFSKISSISIGDLLSKINIRFLGKIKGTHNKDCILGQVVGDGAHDVPKTHLSTEGKVVEKYILSSNNIPQITIDKFVIMPNHIHLIIAVENNGTSKAPSPTNSIISHAVSTLKRFVNKAVGRNIFQRSFHDHIIRSYEDYLQIWNYIDTNPSKWQNDCFYTK